VLRERICALFPRYGFYNALFDVTEEEDVLFHFRFLFETHWGQHLRSLQQYLHALAF
jgi:hypothetical protein